MLLALLLATAHADDDALLRALSVRDPAPACDTLTALAADPVADLRRMAETVELPPWAPMRAARCLVAAHATDAEPALTAWVADPDRAGLASLVLRRTASLPESVAARVVAAAFAGPHVDAARAATAADDRPAVRAAAPDPGEPLESR